MPDKLKLTVHMVSSLDGYIAKRDNSVDWFETKDEYENGAPLENEQDAHEVDCYVMGSRTYEHAQALSENYGWPYGEVPTIVVSSRQLDITRPSVEVFQGSLQELISEKLQPRYKNVWVVGGPAMVTAFLAEGLADEIRHCILPILLGDGVPFYLPMERERPLHLKNVTGFKNGMVELVYEVRK